MRLRGFLIALAGLGLAACAAAPAYAALRGRTRAAPSDFALRWARPTLTNPQTITIADGDFTFRGDVSTDYILAWPSHTHVGLVTITNVHSLISIGGDCTIKPQDPGALDNRFSPGRDQHCLRVSGATGTVSIEGLYPHTDGWQSTDAQMDGLDFDSPAADVQIQNVREEGLFGYYNQIHADCIQPWGGVHSLKVNNFTCYGGYQGLTMQQDLGPIGSAEFHNTNVVLNGQIRYGTSGIGNSGGFLFDVWKKNDGSDSYPIAGDIYLFSQRPDHSTLTSMILTCGNHGQGAPSCQPVTESVGLATIGDANFTVQFHLGMPAGGDFVPANRVGLNYPSNGY